jgi:hypothetical protein
MKPDLEAIRARDAQNLDPDWPSAVDRRALLAYVDALRAAAGKVQCFHCGNLISEAWTRLGPCPSCADLRKLLGENP